MGLFDIEQEIDILKESLKGEREGKDWNMCDYIEGCIACPVIRKKQLLKIIKEYKLPANEWTYNRLLIEVSDHSYMVVDWNNGISGLININKSYRNQRNIWGTHLPQTLRSYKINCRCWSIIPEAIEFFRAFFLTCDEMIDDESKQIINKLFR